MKKLLHSLLIGIMLAWIFLPAAVVIHADLEKRHENERRIAECEKHLPAHLCERTMHNYAPNARDHL